MDHEGKKSPGRERHKQKAVAPGGRNAHITIMKILYLALAVMLGSSGTSVMAQTAAPLTVTTGRVVIAVDSLVAPGTGFVASVWLLDTTMMLGGFNLHLEYDHNALVFDSATFGALTKGEWEYLAVRTGKLTSGDSLAVASFIRMVGLADQQDAANRHPSARSQVGPGEVARLYFYATDDRDFRGLTLPLRFRWGKCDDNSFSDKSGHVLLVGRSVVEGDGRAIAAADSTHAGPREDCFKRRYNAPVRAFDFRNATVRIGE